MPEPKRQPDYGFLAELENAGQQLLTPAEASRVLGITESALYQRRRQGFSPAYNKREDGRVVYLLEVISAYLRGASTASTTESRARRLGLLPAKTITKSRGSKSQPAISRKPGEGVSRDR